MESSRHYSSSKELLLSAAVAKLATEKKTFVKSLIWKNPVTLHDMMQSLLNPLLLTLWVKEALLSSSVHDFRSASSGFKG